MASMTDVKSQLETMHLGFQLPRHLCTRDFKRLSIRTELKRLKSVDDIKKGASKDEAITYQSNAKVYIDRGLLELPKTGLHEPHPVTGICWIASS